MRIRKLEEKDAGFMYEWMHDPLVVKYLRADFQGKVIEECYDFIASARQTTEDFHMAIVDDSDEYMGTVSLKNVTSISAEFAIVIRKCAMGTGVSTYGMKEIMRIGFEDLKLKYIYWCVSAKNVRALSFYDKLGYKRVRPNMIKKFIKGRYAQKEIESYIWYGQSDKREREAELKRECY